MSKVKWEFKIGEDGDITKMDETEIETAFDAAEYAVQFYTDHWREGDDEGTVEEVYVREQGKTKWRYFDVNFETRTEFDAWESGI